MEGIVGLVVVVIVVLIVLLLLISCIKIVPQAKAMVVERLGAYQATWSTGLHFKVPIIDRVARRVDLKEQVVDFAPQPVITKDNVLSDHGSEDVLLRCCESDHGDRESDSDDAP